MNSILPGIANENEFFSDHYLGSVFKDDAKELVSRLLGEQGGSGKAQQQPFAELAKQHANYYADFLEAGIDSGRVASQRAFASKLLSGLGYASAPSFLVDAQDGALPSLFSSVGAEGYPRLWVIEALPPNGDEVGMDPFTLHINAALFSSKQEDRPSIRKGDYYSAINEGIFGLGRPPRFVLLLSIAQAILIDRNKWADNRLLRFDFRTIFTSGSKDVQNAMLALLHKNALVPGFSNSSIDEIDENSVRHAHAVSKDLKFALQESIQLIGQEAARQLVRNNRDARKAAYGLDEEQLTRECLRYMYRLLFLFYIEARPDLGLAPLKAESYRLGYSLESLRDLELIHLKTAEDRDGTYIHECIELLFKLIYSGTPRVADGTTASKPNTRAFQIQPLESQLFDPASTRILNNVTFSNSTLQQVIKLMSLSAPKRSASRGRISYSQLGINQLGSVYEALLSYTGFFATEELVEIKQKGSAAPGPLDATYFAPASKLDDYDEDEIVRDDTRNFILHQKGKFIYRLAGRDRENSASYYTPQILTKCLVKQALKDLLKNLTADEILQLTICEPAMGSAAFLVEAVNQLADAYIARKKDEQGVKMYKHEEETQTRQQIRAYITDRNVFGVDLNPIAMELGQISLWLNCIHEGNYIPWFGDQLFTGNSLIGARRAVFPFQKIGKGNKKAELWYNYPPRPLQNTERRRPDEIYHFLLPDPAMSEYKHMKNIAPGRIKALADWSRVFCLPFDDADLNELGKLSATVDVMFEDIAEAQAKDRASNNDSLSVWGQDRVEPERSSYTVKYRNRAAFQGYGAKKAVPYQRLKTAMNYWCALWNWPLDKVDMLPTRREYISDMQLILRGDSDASKNVLLYRIDEYGPMSFLNDDNQSLVPNPGIGIEQVSKFPRIELALKIASNLNPFHWELELADIFLFRGGFDLLIGNPPWLNQIVDDKQLLSKYMPKLGIGNYSANDVELLKGTILSDAVALKEYTDDCTRIICNRAFLSATQNYPMLQNITNVNLYKCFINKALMLSKHEDKSRVGLLHPVGHFTDPNGAKFRSHIYPRLTELYQFQNQRQDILFSDIAHRERYAINIYKGKVGESTNFRAMFNLFHPKTISASEDQTLIHTDVPGIKDAMNRWDMTGHPDRILNIDGGVLKMFEKFVGNHAETSNTAPPLLFAHSRSIISLLDILSQIDEHYGELRDQMSISTIWHETGDYKKKGIIRRRTKFHHAPSAMIITGPNFYVMNPLAKTPRPNCRTKGDYDSLDLTILNNDYLPRANYEPAIAFENYRHKLPTVVWAENAGQVQHTDYFRVILRSRTNPAGERSMIGAIIPPGIAHVDSCISIAFKDDRTLLELSCLASSLPYDFLAKAMGYVKIHSSTIYSLPRIDLPDSAVFRALQLNCLTLYYKDLWNRNASTLCPDILDAYSHDIDVGAAPHKTSKWTSDCALRNHYARRQALLEIDVIVAIRLGMTFEDLIQIYQTYFPVLRAYDASTWYDSAGRIAFSSSKTYSKVTMDEKEWGLHQNAVSGEYCKRIIGDTTLSDRPADLDIKFRAPYFRPDRVEDYRRAWEHYSKLP